MSLLGTGSYPEEGRSKDVVRTLDYVRELRAETFRETPNNASSALKVSPEVPAS